MLSFAPSDTSQQADVEEENTITSPLFETPRNRDCGRRSYTSLYSCQRCLEKPGCASFRQTPNPFNETYSAFTAVTRWSSMINEPSFSYSRLYDSYSLVNFSSESNGSLGKRNIHPENTSMNKPIPAKCLTMCNLLPHHTQHLIDHLLKIFRSVGPEHLGVVR